MNWQEGSDDVLGGADVSGISISNKVQSDRDSVSREEGEDGVTEDDPVWVILVGCQTLNFGKF